MRNTMSPKRLVKLVAIADEGDWETYEHGVANLCCPCSVPADETMNGVPSVIVFAWYQFPPEAFEGNATLHHECGNNKCIRACHMQVINAP